MNKSNHDKEPIIWGCRDWPYRETGMEGHKLSPMWWAFCIPHLLNFIRKN